MKDFIKRNQKLLSKIVGILLIIIAVGALFWNNQGKNTVSYGSSSSDSLKPVSILNSSSPAKKAKSSHEEVMKAFEERQEEQVKLFLILMIVGGLIFVVYGFATKGKNEQKD